MTLLNLPVFYCLYIHAYTYTQRMYFLLYGDSACNGFGGYKWRDLLFKASSSCMLGKQAPYHQATSSHAKRVFFLFFFDFMMVQKQQPCSRNYTWNYFELGSFPKLVMYSLLLSYAGGKSQLPVTWAGGETTNTAAQLNPVLLRRDVHKSGFSTHFFLFTDTLDLCWVCVDVNPLTSSRASMLSNRKIQGHCWLVK